MITAWHAQAAELHALPGAALRTACICHPLPLPTPTGYIGKTHLCRALAVGSGPWHHRARPLRLHLPVLCPHLCVQRLDGPVTPVGCGSIAGVSIYVGDSVIQQRLAINQAASAASLPLAAHSTAWSDAYQHCWQPYALLVCLAAAPSTQVPSNHGHHAVHRACATDNLPNKQHSACRHL